MRGALTAIRRRRDRAASADWLANIIPTNAIAARRAGRMMLPLVVFAMFPRPQ